jgi:hypothetical protein
VRRARNHHDVVDDHAGQQSANAGDAAAGREHGSSATAHCAFAVDDASVGIVDRRSTVDDRSPRRHSAALHAWHRTGSDDNAAGERRRNATAGAKDPGGSRNHRSRDFESSGHSQQMTVEGSVVTNISSSWVRRLWPIERSVVEHTVHDDVRDRDLPRDEAPVTSPLRDRPQERATFRWPCWPLSGLRQTRSRRRSH